MSKQSMQSNGGAGPHVAVLAYPFTCHPFTLLAFTRGLASAAPNALFSFLCPGKCNSSQQVPSNVRVYNVWDGAPAGNGLEDVALFMKVEHAIFKKGVEVAVAETGRKLSCLVSDSFVRVGKEMAEENGVAWVTYFVSGAAALSSHVYTDLIRQKFRVAATGGEDETLDFIPGMSKVRVRDLPEGIVTGDLDSSFSHMLHQMSQELHQATAVFINSFEELYPSITKDMESKLKKLLSVGPLVFSTPPTTVPDSHGCLPWLDKQKPATVAFISFGSGASPCPPNELIALAEALEASRLPFLWSLRDQAKQHLPKGFVEGANGMVVPWAPQIDVLAHGAVGVFISHGGFNSTLESIASEVPMIVRPFFADQMINGRMVEAVWEIGVVVKGGTFTKNDTINCLDMALAQEKGREWRKNMKAIKEMALTAVGPQGSSAKNFKALLDLVSN